MTDSVTARLTDARTIVLRAALDMPEGEARERVLFAHAALGDALEQRGHDLDREREHGGVLRVIRDTEAA